ncbi:MAG: S-methyl-5-thioribose kinase [Candidatus Dormibacteria bacterium]
MTEAWAPPKGYRQLDSTSAIEFAHRWLVDPREGEEIGDGNLNLVFRVIGAQDASVIVKQAIPYLRVVGESWPLPLDRARVEALALTTQNEICPGQVPHLMHFEPSLAALIMEDLRDHVVLRHGLIQGNRYPNAPEHLGLFCARMLLGTSIWKLDPRQQRQRQAKLVNTDLRAITEALVYEDPFRNAPTNKIEHALVEMAQELWADEELVTAAALLRYEFCTRAEALVHGDLHTGSVMVTAEDTRVIDPEFAFYGPVGFDLGVLLANLAMAHLAHRTQGGADLADWLSVAASTFWVTFESEIGRLWPAGQGSKERFIRGVLGDAARHAGAEMIRRTIGLAQIADTDAIDDEALRLRAKLAVLQGGRALLVGGAAVDSLDHLWGMATIWSR